MEKNKKIIIQIFLFFVLFFSPFLVSAATLYLSPNSGSHNVGGNFSVSIYVSSKDQAINAVSANISYPKDKLEVTSISKAGSILTLWAQEPSFSNGSGSVSLEGIVPNPGYTGSSAKIVQINFKAKNSGNATISFSSGSVLANDGKGTNILAGMSGATFSINKADDSKKEEKPITPTQTESKTVPDLAEVNSSSHSDQDKWYSNSGAIFNWKMSDDVNGVRLSVAKDSKEISNDVFFPVNSKEYKNLADGVWYFNVQLRNQYGWSGISSFRFQIDTEKPSKFDISEIKKEGESNSRAKFLFDAQDELSGIDYFEVKIDDGNYEIWRNIDNKNIYETPALSSGNHSLHVKAVDKAGNFFSNSINFSVNSIEAPVITDSPRVVFLGDKLVIKGTSKYSSYDIRGWLQFRDNEPEAVNLKTDEFGNFELYLDRQLEPGTYRFWVEIIGEDGVSNVFSEKIKFKVKKQFILIDILSNFKMTNVLIIIIIFVIIVLAFVAYVWYKYMHLRDDLLALIYKKEINTCKDINKLKNYYQKKLEKSRGSDSISRKENKAIRETVEQLDNLEKSIEKDFSDIIKKIK